MIIVFSLFCCKHHNNFIYIASISVLRNPDWLKKKPQSTWERIVSIFKKFHQIFSNVVVSMAPSKRNKVSAFSFDTIVV